MKFTLAAPAIFAAAVMAQNKTVTVTDVVATYTTYCPSATMVSVGNMTYTVTAATTLTITNCPCTITSTSVIPSGTAPVSPVPVVNGTSPATQPAGTTPAGSTPAGTSPAAFTGAANVAATAGSAVIAIAAAALMM